MPTLQVTQVTKAYGQKRLFEDVDVAFTERQPLRPHRAERRRQVDLHEDPRRRARAATPERVARPKKTSVLKQDQFAYEDVRVLDVVLQGNKGLWAAHAREGGAARTSRDLTDDDGHRLGDLEGIIAEEDGYTAEADAA